MRQKDLNNEEAFLKNQCTKKIRSVVTFNIEIDGGIILLLWRSGFLNVYRCGLNYYYRTKK